METTKKIESRVVVVDISFFFVANLSIEAMLRYNQLIFFFNLFSGIRSVGGTRNIGRHRKLLSIDDKNLFTVSLTLVENVDVSMR